MATVCPAFASGPLPSARVSIFSPLEAAAGAADGLPGFGPGCALAAGFDAATGLGGGTATGRAVGGAGVGAATGKEFVAGGGTAAGPAPVPDADGALAPAGWLTSGGAVSVFSSPRQPDRK